jgi:hypothetical protein
LVILGGIAGLTLPFIVLKETPLIPLVAFVTIGAIALRCRDAWIQPAKGTYREALMDALVVTSTLLSSEALFWLVAPALLIPAGSFIPGLVAGVTIASICRLTAHRNQPSNLGRRNEALRPFWRVAIIDLLWWAACVFLQYENTYAVPGSDDRNFFLMAATIVTLPLSVKLQGNSLVSLWFGQRIPDKQLGDRLAHDIRTKENIVDLTETERKAQIVRTGFFVLLASLPAVAVWNTVTRSNVVIDWRQVLVDFGAFLALSTMWLEIEQLNIEATKELRKARRVAVENANA